MKCKLYQLMHIQEVQQAYIPFCIRDCRTIPSLSVHPLKQSGNWWFVKVKWNPLYETSNVWLYRHDESYMTGAQIQLDHHHHDHHRTYHNHNQCHKQQYLTYFLCSAFSIGPGIVSKASERFYVHSCSCRSGWRRKNKQHCVNKVLQSSF